MGNAYLTSYVLHVMKVARELNIAVDNEVITRALDYLEKELKAPAPTQVQVQGSVAGKVSATVAPVALRGPAFEAAIG